MNKLKPETLIFLLEYIGAGDGEAIDCDDYEFEGETVEGLSGTYTHSITSLCRQAAELLQAPHQVKPAVHPVSKSTPRPGTYAPSPENHWFAYDQEDGALFFATEEEARECAENQIQNDLECNEGWSEEVDRICVGKLTAISTQVDLQQRPPEEQLDEDGCDESGMYWNPDWEYCCNYRLIPIPHSPAAPEETAARELLTWFADQLANAPEKDLPNIIREGYARIINLASITATRPEAANA